MLGLEIKTLVKVSIIRQQLTTGIHQALYNGIPVVKEMLPVALEFVKVMKALLKDMFTLIPLDSVCWILVEAGLIEQPHQLQKFIRHYIPEQLMYRIIQ